MARPHRTGLDYFPLDTEMDDKIYYVQAKHGMAGFGIVIRLYQAIYAEGYFLLFDERREAIFAQKHGLRVPDLRSVLATCVSAGVFSARLFAEHSILTSSGVQKRYFTAVQRRGEVPVCEEYLLVDGGEFENLVSESSTGVSVDKNPARGELMSAKTPKEKKRKEKKRKGREKKKRHLRHVLLREEEHRLLVERFGAEGAAQWIRTLDDGIEARGYAYKSHYQAILNWARRDREKKGRYL